MLKFLLVNLVAVLIYMTVWFLVARKRHRLDTVDTAWGGGFVLMAWLIVLQHSAAATLTIAILVTIWGGRLAWHLTGRSNKRGKEDPRYLELSKKWKNNFWLRAYLSIFLTQGLLIWIVGLPIEYAAGNTPYASYGYVVIGALVWVAGFVLEAIADHQLSAFIANPNNKGKVLDTGLWRYSRHPNYFGELTQWWGIGIIALHASFGWIGLLGPATLGFLIIFVSGIPPIERRRADNPAYQAYKKRTSPLIPLPPKS